MPRPAPRTVLMLQGPPCRFWRELGDGLRASGVRVLHAGFCLADLVFWRRPGLRLYRGRLADWPAHLARLVREEGVSDILYYADRQPYHAAAIGVARRLGVRAWAIENGYLRPDWLTMEAEGMGAQSRFTRDPAAIRALAGDRPAPDMTPRHRHRFAREAVSEVAFHLLMVAGRPLFPRYVADKHYPPLLDYLCWLRKWTLGRRPARAARAVEAACRARAWPYAVLALQLQSDYQIRASSPYRCLSEMIAETVGSFARHAPAEMRLIVKLHPMDNGWENWPRQVRREAVRHGVADRILTIDGGALEVLLAGARGVVTVNSTVGLHALGQGCPVIALGDAVYDIPSLTHQGGLRRFWTAPEPVDTELLGRYRAALAAAIQVRGSFYAPEGRRVAIADIVRRLAAPEAHWRLDRPVAACGVVRPAPAPADPAQEPALAFE